MKVLEFVDEKSDFSEIDDIDIEDEEDEDDESSSSSELIFSKFPDNINLNKKNIYQKRDIELNLRSIVKEE